MRRERPANTISSSCEHLRKIPSTTCIKSGPVKKLFCILGLPILHTFAADEHCHNIWKTDSASSPQKGQEGSSIILFFHKFSWVGSISWHTRQRKFFSTLGIGTSHKVFHTSLVLPCLEHLANDWATISCWR